MKIESTPDQNLTLALDRYVCYPMETVTLFARLTVPRLNHALINLKLPQMTEMLSIGLSGVENCDLSVLNSGDEGSVLTVPLYKYLQAGESAELRMQVRLHSLELDHYINFSAWLSDADSDSEAPGVIPVSASRITLAVKAHATYLRYLPEIYSYDDFMNRFLMFFESFWKPINQQVAQVENYFDPEITPEAFIPWLASWVGLKIDDSFPKERIRQLLKSAIDFYHCRGTLHSLQLFLELYSGGEVSVKELKAHNLTLGKDARLGEGVALGRANQPGTVCVTLKASKKELERTGFSSEIYSQKISQFIRGIVPAHTIFTLDCQFS